MKKIIITVSSTIMETDIAKTPRYMNDMILFAINNSLPFLPDWKPSITRLSICHCSDSEKEIKYYGYNVSKCDMKKRQYYEFICSNECDNIDEIKLVSQYLAHSVSIYEKKSGMECNTFVHIDLGQIHFEPIEM